jgi:D-glucosaminate-6-phosphate ammonia-lyase
MNKNTVENIYKQLGATPIINAIGSVTMLGGSTPITEVKEAMEMAGDSYVSMMELEESAGTFLANLIGVPAAYVTSGAGSALTLAAAAVMAGDDDILIQQLPDTTGMKNEILIQQRQRYWYDRCLEISGAKLVSCGSDTKTTRKDILEAIGPKTAAIHYYMVEQENDDHVLPLQEIIEIAHNHDLPVLVDAAGQIFPLENFGKYVKMGADFQCIATKYLGAPQSTGLALGSIDMIRKISKQSFVGYEGRRIRGIGRPHKVDRQEIIGAVVATQHWLTINHEDRLSETQKKTQTIIDLISNIQEITVIPIENIIGHQPYGLRIKLNESITTMTLQNVVDKLKNEDPPIWTRIKDEDDFIEIHIFGLLDGEESIVGQRIAKLFK